ncbi:MAG TPA: aspartate kinase [Thermoleophilia bacterium]|nr:aspartate kinase [Thermoleophilia bacterium]
MTIVVQKYGGSSVASTERIMNVAHRIVATFDAGNSVCAVVSARGDTTDELMAMAREITERPPERELDMLLSTGERISCALLAMAIHTLGREAVSFTGSQAGIVTDTTHTKAKIVGISPRRVEEALADGKITLVAGFQGVSTAKDVTTLGRGGSDTTAVALAHALGARVCEIYSDVDGVYTANPSIVPNARKLHAVSYDEMLEMAASGAQVLALRSVEYARRYHVVIHSRSSFSDAEGTWVREEDESMEQAIVSGVTYTTDEAKVTVRGVPDRPGVAAEVFSALADAHVNVDMIIQNVGEQGHSDISCTVPIDDLAAVREALDKVVAALDAKAYTTDDSMAKLSLIGAGMKTHPGVAALMFRTLADKGINLEMISTSPIKVSCVIAKDRVEEAVRALHDAFGLETETVTHERAQRGVGHD